MEHFLFRHTVQSGVWAGHIFAYHDGKGYTIRDALNYWYQNKSKDGVSFRDLCSGPRCNDGCPEELILQDSEGDVWPAGMRITIATIVMATAVISVLVKVCMGVGVATNKHFHFLSFSPFSH